MFVTTGVVAFTAAFFAESALAQLPSLGQPVAQITEPVAGLTQPVAQPVAQVTAPVAQATVPVTQVLAPVAQTAAPVVQQAAPVIQQTSAPVFEAAQPLAEVAAPVLELAQPVVDATTAPVQQVTTPLLQTASPLGLTAPVVGSSAPRVETPPVADVAAESATAQPTSTDATSFVAVTNDPASRALAPAYGDAGSRPDRAGGDSASGLRQSLMGSSVTPRTVAVADGHRASAANPASPRPDAPSAPRGPLGLLVEISATFGSSALLLLVAVLAALFLAAPALGRWLRLRLARWPLPIPLPSLERPG